MKDIDGQEIRVGDLVLVTLFRYKNRIGRVIEATGLDCATIKFSKEQFDWSCFSGDNIFCLFYRKPTSTT